MNHENVESAGEWMGREVGGGGGGRANRNTRRKTPTTSPKIGIAF